VLRAPRLSLTIRGLHDDGGVRAVVGATAGDDIGRGHAFAARGLWPVLPFAGLELAVLGWARGGLSPALGAGQAGPGAGTRAAS